MHNEKIAIEKPKNLRSKDIELWRITEIIECCKYFQQQNLDLVEHDDRTIPMVTLLTNFETETSDYVNDASSPGIKSLMKISEKENINVKNIASFYDDWKFDLKNF